jgi:hypothetical protein
MRRFLIVSLLLAPSIALAQRGGGSRGGGGNRTPNSDFPPMPSGPSLRTRDLEDMSPVKLLIDKRKDLKLTDAQLSALKASEQPLKARNEPIFKTVDSLVGKLRPSMNPSDEERSRMRETRNALMSTLGDLRAVYESVQKNALASLDAEQQTKANELLAKQHEESQKMLAEKLGGGRRGGEGREPQLR